MKLSEQILSAHIDKLSNTDPSLHTIVEKFGYPPFWHRPPGFKTLVRTICEQLLSLAAARTIFKRFEAIAGECTPEDVLSLSVDEMRDVGLSGQKITYIRELARAISEGQLDLDSISTTDDATYIKNTLTKIKGIGNWTAESYMILSLHLPDVFPLGDVAAVNALRMNGLVEEDASKDEIRDFTDRFSPNRTALTLLMWHSYIQMKEITFTP